MSEAVKDYVKFQVLGIEEDLVSEEDKKVINKLKLRKHILETAKQYKNKVFVLETYSLEKQQEIFDKLKLRQGDKTRVTFLNDYNEPVEILGASIRHKKVLLRCRFCKRRKAFSMWLKTFLNELKAGNIRSIYPLKFAAAYFNTIDMSLKETADKLQLIYDKYNKLYENRKHALKRDFEKEISKYTKIEKEAKSFRYQMNSEKALEKAKSYKGVEKTKNYWNSRITEEEKEQLLQWISQNIYSIRVYGLLDGQSGNTLLNNYSDVGQIRYRQKETDDEGKVISQDSITAYISFKNLEGAPIEIIEKVTSPKRKCENVFYNNRLNDKNLALFLLSEYHNKGFKAGVRNLYTQIKLD